MKEVENNTRVILWDLLKDVYKRQGKLSWETPNEVLNAGSHQVTWKFVPKNEALYQGSVSYTHLDVYKRQQ